jgi:hypothetical protein
MHLENPIIPTLSSKSDDEIFDIILDETSEQRLFEAAIKTALERELISQAQADQLFAGDLSVLQYNPANVEELAAPVDPANKKPAKKFKPSKMSLTTSGIYLFVAGLLLFYLGYQNRHPIFEGWHSHPYRSYTIAGLATLVGLVQIIVDQLRKRNKL